MEPKQDLTSEIELIDDDIIVNEEFKMSVAIPYFRDIYNDLVGQSDDKTKGINKVTILSVSSKNLIYLEKSLKASNQFFVPLTV